MWFEIIFLTLCVLVSSQTEKFKHECIFDNFDEEFNYRYCDGDFPWIVTEYERLEVVPFNANNSKCIQATSKSCATSYPIDFSRGAIELDVYLQLLGNNSGLTVTLFSENNVPVIEHQVNRLKENYTQGWNKILVHIENNMVGYFNLKGRSNKEEIIVVASVQYSEYVYTGKRQYYELLQIQLPFAMKLSEKYRTSARKAESESKIIDLKSETNEKYSKQRFRRSIDTSEGTTQSPKYSESDEEGDLDQGKTTDKSSTTSESSPTETENSDSETVIVSSTTKGLDSNQSDNPDQDNNTTQTNNPEQDSINTTSSLTTVPDSDFESTPTETGNTDSDTVTSTTKDPDSNQTDNPEQDNNITQTNNPEQDSTNITSSPTTVPDSDSESSLTETGNTDSETVTSTTKDPESNQTNNPDQDNNTTQTNNPEQDSINTTSSPTTDSDSDSESSPTETGNTDSETVTSTTKDPDSNQTDNPDQDNNTTQTNNPEQDSTNTTSSPTTVPDSDSTQDQQNNFTWSPFTITLVAVGSFVVLSVTAVSAYYCGKIRAQRDDTNFILDQVEDIKPQPIIPRVRNAKRVEV